MADDLAFLFGDGASVPGSPVAHSGVRPVASTPHPAPPPPTAIEWLTLRETHETTSIPVSTLRKWAKRGKVRARLERVGDRELRFLALSDVLHRAETLGREVVPLTPEVVVDLRGEERSAAVEEPAPEPPPAPTTSRDVAVADDHEVEVPNGSILVPLDAWDRLLSQLGNLHEAGQQLADARERAAKAETEAEFLRERLREMRRELRAQERTTQPISGAAQPTFGGDVSLQARWDEWRRRWLGRHSR